MGVHVYVPVVTHKWLKTNKNHRPALKKGKIGTMKFILFFFHLIFFIRIANTLVIIVKLQILELNKCENVISHIMKNVD